MNCEYHADREAVANCIQCSKAVCPECKVVYDDKIYCNACIENKLSPPDKTVIATATSATAENTSGMGSKAEVPAGLGDWNWGGFLLTWIWGIGNNVWISLLALLGLIPCVGWIGSLTMRIILGIKGTEWAWRNKKWESIEHFKKTQRTWMWWGIGMVIFEIIFTVLIIFLLIALFLTIGISGTDWNWRNKSPWQW
jgi:hypothetical protein